MSDLGVVARCNCGNVPSSGSGGQSDQALPQVLILGARRRTGELGEAPSPSTRGGCGRSREEVSWNGVPLVVPPPVRATLSREKHHPGGRVGQDQRSVSGELSDDGWSADVDRLDTVVEGGVNRCPSVSLELTPRFEVGSVDGLRGNEPQMQPDRRGLTVDSVAPLPGLPPARRRGPHCDSWSPLELGWQVAATDGVHHFHIARLVARTPALEVYSIELGELHTIQVKRDDMGAPVLEVLPPSTGRPASESGGLRGGVPDDAR